LTDLFWKGFFNGLKNSLITQPVQGRMEGAVIVFLPITDETINLACRTKHWPNFRFFIWMAELHPDPFSDGVKTSLQSGSFGQLNSYNRI